MANLALLKRAKCGHYVLANAKPNFVELTEQLVHIETGLKKVPTESYIILCNDCASKIKPRKFWNPFSRG